jgi:DNA-binding CsgD family transcriptional regulator
MPKSNAKRDRAAVASDANILRCRLPEVAKPPINVVIEPRRHFLDETQRRIRKEGSPVVLDRDKGEILLAYLANGRGTVRSEVLRLTDLGDIPIPVPSEEVLRRVFDLTAAEARLAQGMARGDTLEEIAFSLGIKMSTARTQLGAVFAKTQTRRQPKLVVRLMRLAQLTERLAELSDRNRES